MVRRLVRHRLERGRHLEQAFEARVLAFAQQALREPQPCTRIGGDARGERERFRHQALGGDDARHQAARQRFRRAQGVAGERHFGRLRHADDARQQPGAAVARDQPDLDEALRERRVLRRDADVAHAREVAAGADRRAVDGGDRRHLEVVERGRKPLDALPVPVA